MQWCGRSVFSNQRRDFNRSSNSSTIVWFVLAVGATPIRNSSTWGSVTYDHRGCGARVRNAALWGTDSKRHTSEDRQGATANRILFDGTRDRSSGRVAFALARPDLAGLSEPTAFDRQREQSVIRTRAVELIRVWEMTHA